jgi:hypothetical protein
VFVLALVLAFMANFTRWWVLGIAAVALGLTGCCRWTKLKSRHRAFMSWGMLAPIGLVGMAAPKDKSWQEVPALRQMEARDSSASAQKRPQ